MPQKTAALPISRRQILKTGALWAGASVTRPLLANAPQIRVFDAAKYGAVGDGKTLDSPAIQRAIDEAAAYSGKSQVLLRGGDDVIGAEFVQLFPLL